MARLRSNLRGCASLGHAAGGRELWQADHSRCALCAQDPPREEYMTFRGVLAGLLVMGTIAASPPGAARAETQADRDACTPDVNGICGQFIPDRDAIIACLKKNIKHLSPACRKVMSRPYHPD
jgi:hypothetical protein